jgi:hypothetical protein
VTEAEQKIAQRWAATKDVLNERQRRIWAGAEAKSIGRGGIAQVSRATGLAPRTIADGIEEIKANDLRKSADQLQTPAEFAALTGLIRRPGGGRKPITCIDPTLATDLQALLEKQQGALGVEDGQNVKSLRSLAKQLEDMGHKVGYETIRKLLKNNNFKFTKESVTKERQQKRNSKLINS